MNGNMSDSDFNMFYYKKRLLDKANKIGFNAYCFLLQEWDKEIINIFTKLQKFLKLTCCYSPERLEKACERAYFYNKDNKEIIKFILKYNFDSLPLNPDTDFSGQYKFKL